MSTFSVVVPTFNRPESLSRLLSALTAIEYPAESFEVIVVDDGGQVPLESVVRGCRERLKLTLLRQGNAGPAGARNFGARRAEGEYLAFVDDDCRPAPGWLGAFEGALRAGGGAVCGGPVRNGLTENAFSAATQLLGDYLYEHYSPTTIPGGFFTTNNIALPRRDFLELEGFDARMRFGEDREFCHRWAESGRPFTCVSEAVVWHFHELRLSSFLRLHFLYGGGTAAFRRRAVMKGLRPVAISPPSWYANLVLSGVRTRGGFPGLVLTLLLGLSQAANGAGFLWRRLRDVATGAP